MQPARQHAFARACFSGDKHGDVQLGNLADNSHGAGHGRGFEQLAFQQNGARIVLYAAGLLRQRPAFGHALLCQHGKKKGREHRRKFNEKVQNLNNIVRLLYKRNMQRAYDFAVDYEGQGNGCVEAYR